MASTATNPTSQSVADGEANSVGVPPPVGTLHTPLPVDQYTRAPSTTIVPAVAPRPAASEVGVPPARGSFITALSGLTTVQ